MTDSKADSHAHDAVSSHVPLDFSTWIQASSPPDALVLGEAGFTYADLYQPSRLAELTERFHAFLASRDQTAHAQLTALAAADGKLATPQATSDALVGAAPHLAAFVARLFGVEAEWKALKSSIQAHDPVWRFKKEFTKKRVLKADAGAGFAPADAAVVARAALVAAGADGALLCSGSEAEELAIAIATLAIFDLDDTAKKLAKAGSGAWSPELARLGEALASALAAVPRAAELGKDALATPADDAAPHARPGAIATFALSAIEAWLATRRKDHHDDAHRWASLHEPKKLNHSELVQIRRPDPKLPELFVGPEEHRREREGFVLSDRRGSTRMVQGEVARGVILMD